MGDISEIRSLVVIGTFVSVFIILTGNIPSIFYPTTVEEKTLADKSEYWEILDILNFNDTHYVNLTSWTPYTTGKVDFGGWIFEQEWFGNVSTQIRRWDAYLRIGEFAIWVPRERANWYHGNTLHGEIFLCSTLNEDYIDGGINNLKYTCEFGETTQITAIFLFNETLYNSPGVAWGNSSLTCFWGIGFDHIQTSYNAWDIIAMVLFFNLPNVHWIINWIISIPLWVAIIYTAFILILRAIGAVFGGGA